MADFEKIKLLTIQDLVQGGLDYLTCLIFDQDIFAKLKSMLAKLISEDRVWHLIVVGDQSSNIEDEIDDLIVSITSRLVMTSSVEIYDFEELFSLATMTSGESVQPSIAYVYDDAQPRLRKIANSLALEARSLT